jgi:hypothetical protein
MITLTLTAEYNAQYDQWEVELPKDFDSHKIVYKQLLVDEADVPDDVPPTWTPEELDEFMRNIPRLETGAEIVKWLEENGNWSDLGITDGAEWSIEMRKKIDGRYQW